MPFEDVQKFSNAAIAKSKMLEEHPGKYFIRSLMAGFFIAVAMVYSNVVGNLFKADEMVAWGKFLGAVVFAIAVLLIVFIGGELFTGNNLVMAFGAYSRAVSWGKVLKVWVVSYLGNFVGCFLFSGIWVLAGSSGTADYFAGFIGGKLSIAPGEMFFRAMLCNFFVCLAVACGTKCKEEGSKFLMIMICISGFVISGFEHCIANMAIFTVAGFVVPGVSITSMLFSMLIVTLGNIVGGAVLLALPLRKMSADK